MEAMSIQLYENDLKNIMIQQGNKNPCLITIRFSTCSSRANEGKKKKERLDSDMTQRKKKKKRKKSNEFIF